MIIQSAEQLRAVTCSYYANNDWERIEQTVKTVQAEVERVIGTAALEWLASAEGCVTEAWQCCAAAIGYMATMRYSRLNDVSHEDEGRKVKMDRENEARPFEWQLARDERAHLTEYYRQLDRLLMLLEPVEAFHASATWQQRQQLIVKDATCLTWLTGMEESAWLFHRLVPMLAESQSFVVKAYGEAFSPEDFRTFENTDTTNYAAQKAVALGALALMGRRTQLQQLPYGLMTAMESDGGGNSRQQPTTDALQAYLKQLSKDQHYWLNEMRRLRDVAAGGAQYSHLQVPENTPDQKYMRL